LNQPKITGPWIETCCQSGGTDVARSPLIEDWAHLWIDPVSGAAIHFASKLTLQSFGEAGLQALLHLLI